MRQDQGVNPGSKLQEGWTSQLLDLFNDGALHRTSTSLNLDVHTEPRAYHWPEVGGMSWVTLALKVKLGEKALRQWPVGGSETLMAKETNFLAGNPIAVLGGVSVGDSGNYSLDQACTFVSCCMSRPLQLRASLRLSNRRTRHTGNRSAKSDEVLPSRGAGRWTTGNGLLLVQNGWCKGGCWCLLMYVNSPVVFNFGKWTQVLYNN